MVGIRILAIATLFLFGVAGVSAQDTADNRRKEKKELREQRLRESKKVLTELTKDQTLIIEANVLRGKYQQHYQVTGDNFVLIEKDRVVLQTASSWGVGFNGLGGITLQGHVTKYEYDVADGNRPIRITANVSMNGAGFGTLRINISADGSATATYQDNWGSRITFVGTAGDPEDSKVFEGMTFI